MESYKKNPDMIVKERLISDIETVIGMINVFIPANDSDRKSLLIGESMLTQLKESLESANTSAELSKILDIGAIRQDWCVLEQQLQQSNINKSVCEWKRSILKGADMKE